MYKQEQSGGKKHKETGSNAILRIEIGPNKEVKVYNLRGELVVSESARPFNGDNNQGRGTQMELGVPAREIQSEPKSQDMKPHIERKVEPEQGSPAKEIQREPKSQNMKLFHDKYTLMVVQDVMNSSLFSPNLPLYTGSGSNNTYTYNTSTHQLDVNISIQNNGLGSAGSFRVGWYLSTNTTISTSDYLVVTASQSSLTNGYYVNKSGSIDLDNVSGLLSGTYYVGIYFDDQFQVSKSDETDNLAYYTPTITYPSVSRITMPLVQG